MNVLQGKIYTGLPLGTGFLHEIGFVTSETAQPVNDGEFIGWPAIWRNINGKFHGTLQFFGDVRIDFLFAAK